MARNKSRRTRILVMDDDNAVRDATAMLLTAKGFDVVALPDGSSGVEAVKAGTFDVVLVDLFMPPGMDGLETTKAIRLHNPSVPIIAVSGFMLGDWRLQMPNFDAMAAEAGACSTLYKPFQPDLLFQAINDALAGAPPATAAAAPEQWPTRRVRGGS